MSIPNWTELPFYYYLAIGGGVVIVLAVILYYTPVSRLKFPGILAAAVGGVAVGVGVGVVGMTYFGYRLPPSETAHATEQPAPEGDGLGKMGRPGLGGRPGGGMGRPGGGGGMGGMRPNSKNDLANLVTKLDVLTRKPLAVTLTDEQKQKVREHLAGLDKEDKLSEDEAKKRLDALLEIVKDQRDTLKSAGFRWPGEGGGRGGFGGQNDDRNPFKEGDNNEHLKSLLGQTGKNPT